MLLEKSEVGEEITLEGAGAVVERLVKDGEGLYEALQIVGERTEDALRELADLARAFSTALGELTGRLGEALGPLGEKLEGFLQTTTEVVKRGAEWLGEHPGVVSAAVRLTVFVAFGVENPELLMQLVQEQPGVIDDIISSFEPLTEALA